MMKVDGSALTGNSPTISATQTVEGGLLMDPIRGDFFRTAHATPQVHAFAALIISFVLNLLFLFKQAYRAPRAES